MLADVVIHDTYVQVDPIILALGLAIAAVPAAAIVLAVYLLATRRQ